MASPPSFRKVNPADSPIFFLALTSDTLPLSTVNEYAETLLAQRISTINGVAQVQVHGQQKYAVRVQVDPSALAARGMGINEVEQAVANANVNLPTGTLYGSDQVFAVQATGQLYTAEAYRPIIVAYRNGSPMRLSEIGTRHRQRAKRQGRRLVQGQARHRAGHPAPARHQHRRGRGQDQEAAAARSAPKSRPRIEHQRTLRPLRSPSASRCRTWSSRCCSRWRWW